MKCDGYSDDDIRRRHDLAILIHGFTTYAVAPRPDDTAASHTVPSQWIHTLGLHRHGLPELVLVEIKVHAAHEMLREVGAGLLAGDPLDELCADLDLRTGPVHPEHLRGELFWEWADHFHADPASVEWRQLFPGESYFCECHAHTAVPLDQPGPLRLINPGPNRALRRAAARWRPRNVGR